jgi:Transposase DDE domain
MILRQALPRIKDFLRATGLAPALHDYLLRFIAAFLLHPGRMSASQVAQVIRTEPRHRAQVGRFLAGLPGLAERPWLEGACARLLALASRAGKWLFVIDQTYAGQQGTKAENTFSTAHNGRRQKHARKHNRKKKKQQRRCCHCFIFGLLLTPDGIRVARFKSYYTKDYCKAKGLRYRKQTAYAADLIRELVVPAGAEVVVLGDTAFDAEPIQQACADRGFRWIVAMNGERVLPGACRPRPKVTSLVAGLSADQFAPIRLVPGQGRFVAQRRIARCRVGPKAKARTFYVHQERRTVVSVGEVQVAFSTTIPPIPGKRVEVQKILLTNDLALSAAEVVELYDLRWQIELFFKEVKGTLGLHQYRFRRFAHVERWVELCVLTFLYLEWYRLQRLRQRRLRAADRRWWRSQRSHGLVLAIRQEVEEDDLKAILRLAGTKTGLRKLRQKLRAAVPLEYRRTG